MDNMKEAKPTSAACVICGQRGEGGMEWRDGEFVLDG